MELLKIFQDLANGAIQRGLLATVQDGHNLFIALQELKDLIQEKEILHKRVSELERERDKAIAP